MKKLYPLRKRAFRAALVTLLLVTAGVTQVYAQVGTINGLFSVSADEQVYFSKGNLQYQASTNTWRFAQCQWDYVGAGNSSISENNANNADWIDLFGWGTSGYDHGAVCYQPWSTSNYIHSYYAYGSESYNLFDQTGQADWGYNAISNGDNTENSGWRTLTRDEWDYVFNTRSTSSGIRYAKAKVNNVNGVILLPDDWSANYYTLSNTNQSGVSFATNVISASQWLTLEQHGAVFLPAAGNRSGTSVVNVGSYGYYWSASYYGNYGACYVYFNDGYLNASYNDLRYYGLSVRLVRAVENYSFGINATPNPAGGGVVSGEGAYQEGAVCTLTATPAAGWTFVNWTENGAVVSTNTTYTFTVSSSRWLQAHFSRPGNITFEDANVKAICVANWDANGDGELSYEEAAAVTNLGEVFQNNTSITSFKELQYFTGLSAICYRAFKNCSNLVTIGIPNTVVLIGNYAFSGCDALTSVYYAGDVEGWCGILFSNYYSNPLNNGSGLLYFNNVLVRNLVIPNTMTSIGNYAFCNYTKLLSVALPNALTSIGNYAFSDCSGLTSGLSLPNALTSIGNYAFSNCSGLTSGLSLPNTLTSIGEGAFDGCSGLSGELTLPNSLSYLGDHAFRNCSGFTGNLTLPNTLTSIGNEVFAGCINFNGTMVLPASLTSIGEGAFYNCSGFTGELMLPNTITVIGSDAFRFCHGFTGVLTLPESLNAINTNTFESCDGFTSVIIPEAVTNVGAYAFYDCDGLTSVTIGNNVNQIGSSAFYSCNSLQEVVYNATSCSSGNLFQSCNNLHALTLGENVVTLGDNAFTYCTSLQSIRSLAVNPPIITSTVFPSSIMDVALYVPCEAKAAYQADPIWKNFTNYQNAAYELVALPENEEQGSVTILQAGNCDDPTSTVKADPNLHYGFSCWTKNGEVVSTDRVYTFDLEENTKLIAQFVANDSVSLHWVPNDQNYSTNMFVAVAVEIDGEEQASSYLELGAFCGDECRGSVVPEYYVNSGRFVYPLMLFGNNGDVITFKLFDHNGQQELPLSCETTMIYNCEAVTDPSNPLVVSFISTVNIYADVNPYGSGEVSGAGSYYPGVTVTLTATPNDGFAFNSWKENGAVVSTDMAYSFTVEGTRYLTAYFDYVQTTTFATGWNWWSSYIDLPGTEILNQLENGLGDSGMQIKSRGPYVQCNAGMWLGSLTQIDNEQCYMVRTSNACQVNIIGPVTVPYNHPITINNGWNWIGFPCAYTTNVQTALSGFTPEVGDIIKGRYAAATCTMGDNGLEWWGSLNSLQSGMGYQYHSKAAETKSLTFVSGRGENIEANVTAESNVYQPVVDEFADNMVVMAVLELDGQELRGDHYELAAFAGDECRGSVKLMYAEALDRYVAFMVVFGEQDEELVFRVTDGSSTITAVERTAFAVNGVMGSLKEPCVLHFRGAGVADELMSAVSVYPNPSNGVFVVEGENIRRVEAFNAFGQCVFAHEGNDNALKVDLGQCANGVYLIRVMTSERVSNHSVVKQ